MPVVMMQHPSSPALAPSVLHTPNQAPTQLRRATYIHISDLTSAYNMDHARLEEELARVKEEEDKKKHSLEAALSSSPSSIRVPTELDTSHSQRRLQPPRTGYNLCVLVGNVKIVVDKSRVDGSRVRLAEVEVGDETGVVSLRARDEQIDLLQNLSEKHGTVVLRNCTLELYQGKHIRLAVTKWGKLTDYPDQIASTPPPPSKINRDRNFSLIDLTVVASEMVSEAYPYSQHHSSPDSDNQSHSAPRTPQYGPSNQHGRYNKGTRRPPTYAKTGGPIPGIGHTGHYSEQQGLQQAMSGYHPMAAMQGYAEVSPYPYGQSPEGLVASQHQLMYQRQQYQLQQQRQMHHMYADQRQNVPHSPMLAPGIGPSSSFESYGGSVGMSEAQVGPFSMPSTPQSSRGIVNQPPPSPGMNPKAPTYRYDPHQI